MRDPRGVDRITAVLTCENDSEKSASFMQKSTSYDMPAVIKNTTKVDSEQKQEYGIGDNANHSKNVECVSESNVSALVTTSTSEKTTRLDLADAENDIDAKMEESDNSVKVISECDANVELHKTLNGAEDAATENIDDIVYVDVSARTTEKQTITPVPEIQSSSGGIVKNVVTNKVPPSTESPVASDNGTIEINDQRSSKTAAITTNSNKRKLSISSEDEQPPAAKILRTELESNIASYDKILHGMLAKSTTSNDPDNVQNDIDQLSNEIEALNEAARAKELEWNNILYLKKMKEDMLVRLNRKKTVMEIMSTKIIDDPENLLYTINNSNNNNNNNDNSNCNDANLLQADDNFVDKNGMLDVRKQLVVPTTSFIMSRCNMNSSDIAKERSNMNSLDLAKEKSNISKLHKNIRPKSEQNNCSDATIAAATATLTNFVTSIPRSSPAIQLQQQHEYLQQRLREEEQKLLALQDGGGNKMQVGRQGPIKDVKSLIDDFRQRHPEQVPRRGRRMKNVNPNAYFGDHGTNCAGPGDNNDMSSPPSSNDSTYNNSQMLFASAKNQSNAYASAGTFKHSFDDLSTKIGNSPLTSTPLFKNQQNTSLGYPEVTLHPIQSSHSLIQNQKLGKDNSQTDAAHTSLLHGILTKSTRQRGTSTITSGMASNAGASVGNTYSPTLARLLTAPERNFAMNSVPVTNTSGNNNNNTFFTATQAAAAGINLTKNGVSRMQQQLQQNQPEISCLPISQILAFQQQNQNNSLLHQQLQRHQRDINKYRPKTNAFLCGTDDDEAEDSVDRLVIDEGDQYSNSDIAGPSGLGRNNNDAELPECQGCKKREAQFVCADCQRQWYCSRECQVQAWDEHSEVCAR